MTEAEQLIAPIKELIALVEEMASHLEAVMRVSPDCKRCAHLVAKARETINPNTGANDA